MLTLSSLKLSLVKAYHLSATLLISLLKLFPLFVSQEPAYHNWIKWHSRWFLVLQTLAQCILPPHFRHVENPQRSSPHQCKVKLGRTGWTRAGTWGNNPMGEIVVSLLGSDFYKIYAFAPYKITRILLIPLIKSCITFSCLLSTSTVEITIGN